MAKIRRTIESTRPIRFEISPSRKVSLTSRASRRVTRILTGRSKNRVPYESVIGATIAVTQRMRNILAIFEPSTFPIAISVSPEMAAKSDTISSGILVPIATIVRPIIASEILHFFARAIDPSTRRLPPTVRRTSQAMIAKSERSIGKNDFLDYKKKWMIPKFRF